MTVYVRLTEPEPPAYHPNGTCQQRLPPRGEGEEALRVTNAALATSWAPMRRQDPRLLIFDSRRSERQGRDKSVPARWLAQRFWRSSCKSRQALRYCFF